MTVRRLLMIRELMSVKLRLILNYTRESTACLLDKRGPLKKREFLDKTWPACHTWGPVRDSLEMARLIYMGPASGIPWRLACPTHGRPSASATERNGTESSSRATTDGKDSLLQMVRSSEARGRQRSTTYNDTATTNNRTVSGRCCSVDVCMPGSYKQTTTRRGQIPRTHVGVFGR